ncbi:MAG TPA: Gfo/Idh/MocA family oxidoreductase [Limnochordia bacterium]|nr:Gfo/Idh/MocA family oxidoreductase [Limnochordia bacterium]
MSSPIRVGLLGLGRSGWGIHADGLDKHSSYQVAAVADPLAERRDEAKARFGCACYETPEALIAESDVDAVVVATPSHTHVPLALAALAAGKHAVVEKPFAQSAAEVDQLVAAAKKAGRVVTCYQPRRFDAEFLEIQEWITSGRLGRIISIRLGIYRFQRRADWQMLRKYGGGELSNTTPHPLDQLLLLLGDGDIELCADLQRGVGAGDAEDHVMLVLKHASGTVGTIEVTNCCALPLPSWVIMGTYGTLLQRGRELTAKWFDPSEVGELTLDEGAAKGRKYGTGEEIPWQEKTWKPELVRPQSLAFYDRLEGTIRGGEPVYVRPEETRRQIELIEEARRQTGIL